MLNSVSSSPTHSDSGYAESPTRQSSTSSVDSLNHASVPPSRPARTLVLCFDGTGDQFDADVCPFYVSSCLADPLFGLEEL